MLKEIEMHRTLMVIVFALSFVKVSFSQNLENKSEDAVSIDESIRFGVLKNGITYYIKPLENPEEKLNMVFIVKTGSFDEEVHETDFAHHIEHLAFRPSENFPEGLKGNPKLLSTLGMNFRELGAVTSGNFTRYNYIPPFQNSKAILTGLKWFRDISDGLDLSEQSINRERGVLLQEFLAGEATQDQQKTEEILNSKIFPCLDSHQDFVEKNKSFPFKDLQEYYFRWYRPDRMAISIVGKIKNVDSIEKLIKTTFESLEPSGKIKESFNCGGNYLESPKSFAVVRSDPESLRNVHGVSNLITLFFRDPFSWKKSEGLDGAKRKIKINLLTKILNQRFKEKEMAYNISSKRYSSHLFLMNNRITEPISAIEINISSENDFEKESIEESIYLLKQFRKYGIQQEEFDDAKNNLLENKDPESPESPDYWINEIINHYAFGEALPTGKNSLIREWILELTKEELNDFIEVVISPMPDDIGIIIPEGDNTVLISEAKTRKTIKNAFKKTVLPFEREQPPKQLLSKKELRLLNVQTENFKPTKKEGNISTYKLKNGISVILRPTRTSSNKQNITLHGFSPNGAMCFPKEDYFSAIYSTRIILHSGAKNFTKFDLDRYYKDFDSVQIKISPYITYNETGIKAEGSNQKIDEMLQLVYLYIAKPRKDSLAFEDWKNLFLEGTSASMNTSNDLFDELNVLTDDFSRLPQASRSISSIKRIKFDKVYGIYNSLFSDIGDFTFIVSGEFNEAEILPLLQKYLGNIPSKKKLDCNTLKITGVLPKGPVSKKLNSPDLYETINSFYGLRYVWPQELQRDWKEEIKVKALGYLASNLVFGLRAKEGLSLYYFSAAGEYNRVMNRNQVSFQYVCNPEELSVVKSKTSQIIQKIKNGDVSNEVFQIAMNELQNGYDKDYLMTPQKSAERFYRNKRYKEPIICPSEMETYIETLEIQDLQNMAQKFFQEEFFYEIIMEN